jgi:hypothetical protein
MYHILVTGISNTAFICSENALSLEPESFSVNSVLSEKCEISLRRTPKGGGGPPGCRSPPPTTKFKKKTEFVDTISKVLHDFPFQFKSSTQVG